MARLRDAGSANEGEEFVSSLLYNNSRPRIQWLGDVWDDHQRIVIFIKRGGSLSRFEGMAKGKRKGKGRGGFLLIELSKYIEMNEGSWYSPQKISSFLGF